jgi:NAD/NADP transhydrogenase alpha subunit
LVPKVIAQLDAKAIEVIVEPGAGAGARILDQSFVGAGGLHTIDAGHQRHSWHCGPGGTPTDAPFGREHYCLSLL